MNAALAQRHAALEKAQEVRLARAALKIALKAGDILLGDALLADCARSAQVWVLLRALPGVGAVKARRLLRDAGVSEAVRVAGLTVRQRALLVDLAGES